MTMDDQIVDRFNWIYYITIILCVLQLLTIVVIVLLGKALLDLKRSIQTHKEIPQPIVNVTAPQSPQNLHPGVAIGNKQKPELNEVIEVVPSPLPAKRRHLSASEAPTKQDNHRISSTSSGAVSRDSGTGSIWERNQSLSSDYCERRSRVPSQTSQVRVSVHEDSRTASDASGFSAGFKGTTTANNISLTLSQNSENDDQSSHINRLNTMAIEDIDSDRPRSKVTLGTTRVEAELSVGFEDQDEIYENRNIIAMMMHENSQERSSLTDNNQNIRRSGDHSIYSNCEITDQQRE